MNNMPPKPKDGLPPDIREAIKRAMPQENYVHGVTKDGQEFRLIAIPLEDASNPPVKGPARLGLMAHLGLGDLED